MPDKSAASPKVKVNRVVTLLHRIRDHYGTTIVTVTHDPDVAAGLDRAIGLHEGHLTTDTAT